MNLVRNAEQQTKLIDDIWEIVEPLIGVGLDDIDTRDMKIEVRDSLIKKFGYEQIK